MSFICNSFHCLLDILIVIENSPAHFQSYYFKVFVVLLYAFVCLRVYANSWWTRTIKFLKMTY